MKRFPYVSMPSLKALAKGGMYLRRKYKKRTSSKKKYKKTFKGKSKKMPDQRWTRMEYEDTANPDYFMFTGNSNVRYMGYQNTGGLIPFSRAIAGSVVRDILSKNGIKYATWNSTAEGSVGEANIWAERCGRIKFFFRGQGVDGELVDRDHYMKNVSGTPTKTETLVSTYTGTSLRSLWDITEDVREMLMDSARRGFYVYAYEVHVFREISSLPVDERWTIKFRDPNFSMASVNLTISTYLNMTNQTPATEIADLGDDTRFNTNRSDTVPLKCDMYKFRNLAPLFRDDVLSATLAPLQDGTTHPFHDIHLSQKMDSQQGILDLRKWHNATHGMFRPLTTPPNGATLFKNLGSRSGCGTMNPGGTLGKKLEFKYVGGIKSLFQQAVPQDKYADPSDATDPALDKDAQVLLNRVSKGDAFVFAFSRIKNTNRDILVVPHVRVARKIYTSCYVQPYKSAPLPVCKNPNPDFTQDPGYEVAAP